MFSGNVQMQWHTKENQEEYPCVAKSNKEFYITTGLEWIVVPLLKLWRKTDVFILLIQTPFISIQIIL